MPHLVVRLNPHLPPLGDTYIVRGRHESHVVATHKKRGGGVINKTSAIDITSRASQAEPRVILTGRPRSARACSRAPRETPIKLNSIRLHHAPLSAIFYAAASEGLCVWSLNKPADISAASKLQMQSNTRGTSKRTVFQRGHAPKSVSLMCPDAATSTLAAFKSRYTYPG